MAPALRGLHNEYMNYYLTIGKNVVLNKMREVFA